MRPAPHPLGTYPLYSVLVYGVLRICFTVVYIDSRCLRILGPREHHHIRRRRLGHNRALPSRAPNRRFLEKPNRRLGHPGQIAVAVRVDRAEQILRGLLGQIRFLEHPLRRVDVGQVQRRPGMARVEDGG